MPRKPQIIKKDYVVGIGVEPKMLKAIDQAARDEKRTRADYIRQLILSDLAKRGYHA